MTLLSLIVMEPGSDWPGRIGDSESVVELGEFDDAMTSHRGPQSDEVEGHSPGSVAPSRGGLLGPRLRSTFQRMGVAATTSCARTPILSG